MCFSAPIGTPAPAVHLPDPFFKRDVHHAGAHGARLIRGDRPRGRPAAGAGTAGQAPDARAPPSPRAAAPWSSVVTLVPRNCLTGSPHSAILPPSKVLCPTWNNRKARTLFRFLTHKIRHFVITLCLTVAIALGVTACKSMLTKPEQPTQNTGDRVYTMDEVSQWLGEAVQDPRYSAVTQFMAKRGLQPRLDVAVAGEGAEAGQPMAAVLLIPFGGPDPDSQGVIRIVRRGSATTWDAALLHREQEPNTISSQELVVTERGVTVSPTIEGHTWFSRFITCLLAGCGWEALSCWVAGPGFWACLAVRCGVWAIICAGVANIP